MKKLGLTVVQKGILEGAEQNRKIRVLGGWPQERYGRTRALELLNGKRMYEEVSIQKEGKQLENANEIPKLMEEMVLEDEKWQEGVNKLHESISQDIRKSQGVIRPESTNHQEAIDDEREVIVEGVK